MNVVRLKHNTYLMTAVEERVEIMKSTSSCVGQQEHLDGVCDLKLGVMSLIIYDFTKLLLQNYLKKSKQFF